MAPGRFIKAAVALAVAAVSLATSPVLVFAGARRVKLQKVVRPPAVDEMQLAGFGAAAAEGSKLLSDVHLGYAGEIEVGSPGQRVAVVFDTGSSNLWVPQSTAVVSLSTHASFDSLRSSSFVPTNDRFAIGYGSGYVRGLYCRDTISIGDLKIVNFTFAEVADTSGLMNYNSTNYDGILGLGLEGLVEGNAPTVMQQLWKSGQLDEPVFSFFLGDDASSELVIGGVAPEHYIGDFTYVPVVDRSFWATPLASVSVNGVASFISPKVAILDSGTSLLDGPEDEVKAIVALLGAQKVNNMYVVSCSKVVPALVFNIGGQDFELQKEDLIVEQVGVLCVLGFTSMPRVSMDKSWILGNVFLRKYYVQFDWVQRRMGFALANRSGLGFFV